MEYLEKRVRYLRTFDFIHVDLVVRACGTKASGPEF